MIWRALLIASGIIILHQTGQHYFFSLIPEQSNRLEVTGFFNLVRVWNKGVSFGMLNNIAYGQWILSALAISISIVLVFLIKKTTSNLQVIAYSLVLGGALGNTLDRFIHGAVADYLDFHAYGHHWPAFNFTDAAICVGVMLLILPTNRAAKTD